MRQLRTIRTIAFVATCSVIFALFIQQTTMQSPTAMTQSASALETVASYFKLIQPAVSSSVASDSPNSSSSSTSSTSSISSATANPENTSTPTNKPENTPSVNTSRPPVTTTGTRTMLFDQIPDNATEAKSYAKSMASRYKQFANAGLVPLAVLESDPSDGSTFASAGFWEGVRVYYQTLKDSGITSAMLGEQIIFSEANSHMIWGAQINPNASAYKTNLQKYINTMKSVYPDSHAAALLDGFTFEASDEGWENPINLDINAYVGGVQGLNTFYLQGFPWLSITNPARDRVNPDEYTHISKLTNAFSSLQAQGTMVGINSGAIVAQKRGNRNLTTEQVRKQTEGLTTVIKNFLAKHGQLKVNIFSENKLNTAEGKDWNFPAKLGEEYYQKWKQELIAKGAVFSEYR